VEQVIADLKNGLIAHLPSGVCTANAVWLALTTIAFNLLHRCRGRRTRSGNGSPSTPRRRSLRSRLAPSVPSGGSPRTARPGSTDSTDHLVVVERAVRPGENQGPGRGVGAGRLRRRRRVVTSRAAPRAEFVDPLRSRAGGHDRRRRASYLRWHRGRVRRVGGEILFSFDSARK
jgi:hypothetical protein